MSKQSHTRGPWKVTQSSNKSNGTDWRDIIGTSETGDVYVGEALKQDAHLIASAPCLLEELEYLMELNDADELPGDADIKRIKALINKARGGE